jgi:type IV pilus assembly protein PilW
MTCLPLVLANRLPASGRVPPAPPRQSGFTLIEMMIALTIGLLLLVAMSVVFVGTSTSRREMEISADVIETGRYALDTLNRELSQAGFYGTLLTPVGATNLPCSTAVSDWADSLPFHVFGWNSSTGAADADPTCITRKPGTDAIFIQRASSCFVGETASGVSICPPQDNNNAYIQVQECGEKYAAGALVLQQGATVFPLETNACDGAPSVIRRIVRRIYYVSSANVLNYVEVRLDGVQQPVPIAENIEQMQIEYAIDTNGDGTADEFKSSPTAAQWPQAIGARVWLVSLSTSTSRNASTSSDLSIQMGDFTQVVPASTAAVQKRRVYSSYIPFVTPKARFES